MSNRWKSKTAFGEVIYELNDENLFTYILSNWDGIWSIIKFDLELDRKPIETKNGDKFFNSPEFATPEKAMQWFEENVIC